ncbi:zinc finger CCCH domain-containing protein 19-like [Iris pallida]|uniref:Zinc finger CCCH domain-containing protein 19-like n=1 Tax=Iris pallida TaxID=29817 RepID=A0AAX6EE06_IRIPA|nr:zinc finger CCCH domain-containing protein 19-like [Iris pallida]
MEEPESEPRNPSDLSMEDPAILQSEEQEKEQPIQEEGDRGIHDGSLKEQAAEERGGGGGDGVVGEDGSLKNDEGKEEDVVEGGALLGRSGEEPESELTPVGVEEREGGGDGVIGEDGLLKNEEEEVKDAEVRSVEESEAAGAGNCSSLNPGEEKQAPALDGEEERESEGKEVDNQMEEEKLRPLDNERGVSECGEKEEEMKLVKEEDEKEVNAPLVQPKEESEQEMKEGNEEYEHGMEEKKAPLEDSTGTEICQSNEEEMEPPLPGEEKPPLIQPGEGSEKIEPEKPEELEEVASEPPVEGGEADKMAVDDATDATKVAAKRGAKGRKKVPVKGHDEPLGDEEDEDGPAKAAGKRGTKICKNTHTKDRDEATGEGETKEAKADSAGPSKTAGSSGNLSGKKRGRPRTGQGGRIRGPPKQKEDEESLCFICFDGGDLVVCDHRGCPKVYHPSCVNRDDAYFQAKGQWNCGWHICSKCTKSSRYMCYTCTYSLCKGCIKEAGFVFVRQNKGFCETCIKTVMLIETNEYEDETMAGLDFDDKNSWLYLFKDYWVELKEKLSLTLEELTRARILSKDSNVASQFEKPLDNLGEASDDQGGSSSSFPGGRKASVSSSKKARKRSRKNKEDSVKEVEAEGTSSSEEPEWASKELLEFVAHMKDGDRSVLSQFDVQALLLHYIRLNNLRDPRNRGQIRCDSRLWTLFGKSRVGHLEMLKLLESHFLLKEASPLATDDNQGGVVDPDPSQMEGNSDASTKIALYLKRKSRRKVDGNEPAHIDDYAAIDVHNINFLYLRRNLMEELLNEIDTFSEYVVGSFVRIRISALGQKQDLYRLVQVVGTGKAAEKYKIGKRATDITLEILNLDKREYITMDIISNQDFTEEECKRLRQSVKCGLIDRLTVGEVQEKARALQNARVNDWLESEKLRLGNLRDRASEKGRRKEYPFI